MENYWGVFNKKTGKCVVDVYGQFKMYNSRDKARDVADVLNSLGEKPTVCVKHLLDVI
jgi:hypothetical protein